jgi:hypothetical protein
MFNFFGLGGAGSWDRSTRAFTNVTEATTNEMGDTMRALFRGGDTLQRGMVDLFLAPFNIGNPCGGGARDRVRRDGDNDRGRRSADETRRGDWGDPARGGWGDRGRDAGWADAAARAASAGADAVQAGVDAAARAVRRAPQEVPSPPQPSAPAASDPSLGWGPMPR